MTGEGQHRPPLLPVSVLGLVTIVSYGACYYSYGVLIEPIRTGTHWPDAALGGIFSAILFINGAAGMLAGRALDRVGGRPVFLLAASLGTGAMLVSSFQDRLLFFAIAYAGGCGLVGALGYYHITQSIVARAAPEAPARAIIWLTLFGVFAGPLYQPLTAWLVETAGWRSTIRIESGTVAAAFILAVVLVDGRGRAPRDTPLEHATDALRNAWRSREMRVWLVATLIASAAVDVFVVYQVPAMTRAGLSLGVAAAVAGFRGMAQLAGRLPLGRLVDGLGARLALVLAYSLGAIAALLLLGSGTLALALVLSLFAGASFGAKDSLQGVYTYELVDPRHLGTLLGAQQAVVGIGGAIGPVVAGVLLGATGSFTPTILVIAAAFAAATGVLLFGGRRRRSPLDKSAEAGSTVTAAGPAYRRRSGSSRGPNDDKPTA